MSRKDEQAYPVPGPTVTANGEVCYASNGLTIREEFIKAAMQGLCAASATDGAAIVDVARSAIAMADATIEAMEGK